MPQTKKKNPLDDLYPTAPTVTPTPLSSNPLDDLYKPQLSNPLDDIFKPPEQEPGLMTGIAAMIQGSPTAQKVVGTISPILEFLSRPNYASAKFADSLANESKNVFDAALDAFNELIATGAKQEKLSYSDVIKRQSPQFALDNPIATTILGFLGDIALDPTTYFGVGLTKDGITVGGKVLTKPTKEIFREGLEKASVKAFVGKEGTIELIGKLEKANNIKPKFEEVEDLFRYMSNDVAPIGKKGIDVEDDTLNLVKFVNRNPEGKATGILEINFDDAGKILSSSLGVDPSIKGLNSIAYKLYKTAKEAGYDLSKAATETEKFTSEGLNFAKRVVEKELKDVGYFDAVKAKQTEISELLNKLSGDPNIQLAETLAKSETLQDLKRFGKERIPDELYRSEVRERITQRISALAEANPELQKQFFEKSGIYLKAGIPFGKQVDVLRIAGLEGLTNKVKAVSSYLESAKGFSVLGKKFNPGQRLSKSVDILARTFNRDYGIAPEYIDLRNDLENQLGYITGQVVRDTRKLFNDVDKEGRERIGSAMLWVDDQTRILEDVSKDIGGVGSDEAAELFNRGLDKFKLTDTEKAIAVALRQDYAEAGLVEMRANLLKNNLINYSPRGYEVIGDPNDFQMISRAKFNPDAAPSAYLSSSQQRKYVTNAEAEAAGLVPELDAAMLYAHRMISSKRALEIKQFRDSVKELFGTVKQKTEIAHTGILPTTIIGQAIPQRVIDDMRMIGQAVYPKDLDGTIKDWIKGYDQLMRLFKRGATTIRPGFAVKQSISNTIQSALVSGVRAFKMLDPRVAVDAAFLLGTRGNLSNNIPEFLNNFITRTFTGNSGLDAVLAQRVVLSKIVGENQLMDFAKDFKLRTALGDTYTGEEIVRLARENGIIRDIDSTGEQFSRKVAQELDNNYSVKSVAKELSKVWNHAALVEDYSRMGLFINGLRMGKSAEESTKLVNKALFDFQRGLSGFERDVVRRIIPFYSFQRFAIPFILKETLKQPGNPATVEKFVRTMEKLLVTGDGLTPAEENVLNGNKDNYIISQPKMLSGFDEKGRVHLNILNNLTPFDVLNLFSYNQDGSVDYRKTAEKTVLGSLTPFLKVPLEAMLGVDFFTQKTIKEASQFGNLQGSLSTLLPKYAKELLGWEDRTNLQTGKTTTFISPWMGYYAMQFFPALRDIIKGNEDVDYSGSNPMFRAALATMNTLVESAKVVGTTKLDLKAQDEYEKLKILGAQKNLFSELMKAKVRGSKTDFDKAQEDFNKLLEIFQTNNRIRNQFSIRGQGIGQQDEENQPAQSPIPMGQSFPK